MLFHSHNSIIARNHSIIYSLKVFCLRKRDKHYSTKYIILVERQINKLSACTPEILIILKAKLSAMQQILQ